MIKKILRGINLASYEHKKEDELIIRFEYLFILKSEIERLRNKEIILEGKIKNLQSEINRLNGKLLECENEKDNKIDKFDKYF